MSEFSNVAFNVIASIGNIRVRKINTSRSKLYMMFDVIHEIGDIISVDKDAEGKTVSKKIKIRLSTKDKIAVIRDKRGNEGILLKDILVQGCDVEKSWIFMNRSLGIICLTEETVGDYNPCRIAITEDGEVIYKDDGNITEWKFLERVAEQEILRGKVEIDIENNIVQTKHTKGICKYTSDKNNILLMIKAYSEHRTNTKCIAILDVERNKILERIFV